MPRDTAETDNAAPAAAPTMGRWVKPLTGTGQRAKSTMKGPGLSTLGEDVVTNVWETPTKRPWQQNESTAAMAADFAKMGISKKTMDPSNAPGNSQLSTQYNPRKSELPTQMTVREENGRPAQWIRTELCVRSPWGRANFAKGLIITLPFHVPNTNENTTEDDDCLAKTNEGPVYSKRRMAVVLWRHKTDMICLPLYSWNSIGILKIPKYLREEYVEIVNYGSAGSYDKEGVNDVLEAQMTRPFDRKGAVHASGAFRVNYQEDIARVGKLTDKSLERLTNLVNRLIKTTQAEKY